MGDAHVCLECGGEIATYESAVLGTWPDDRSHDCLPVWRAWRDRAVAAEALVADMERVVDAWFGESAKALRMVVETEMRSRR